MGKLAWKIRKLGLARIRKSRSYPTGPAALDLRDLVWVWAHRPQGWRHHKALTRHSNGGAFGAMDRACVEVCPVEAIFAEEDTPEQWKDYIQINAEAFE